MSSWKVRTPACARCPGKLEPLCLSLRAQTTKGQGYAASESPRRAAGPDLSALLMAGSGHFGQVASAWVRLLPRPATTALVRLSFRSSADLVSALMEILSEGASASKVRLSKAAESCAAELELCGSPRSLGRDKATCLRWAAALHGRELGAEPTGAQPFHATSERELGWAGDVARALDGGEVVDCFRLARDSVITIGATSGDIVGRRSVVADRPLRRARRAARPSSAKE